MGRLGVQGGVPVRVGHRYTFRTMGHPLIRRAHDTVSWRIRQVDRFLGGLLLDSNGVLWLAFNIFIIVGEHLHSI